MKTIDLSHTLDENISVYPGTPKPKIEIIATHEKNGYAELLLTFPTHTATHLDAPFHMIPGGKRLTDLPVEQFAGKAIVIPYPKNEFDLQWIKQYEEQINSVDFVILQTGAEQRWKTGKYCDDYPALTAEAAKWLTTKHLKGIGLDAISIDKPDATEFIIHKIILGSGMIIIENLKNLEQLKGKIFDFYALPLPVKDADGAPCRAIAITD